MNKENYIKYVKENFKGKSQKILINQICEFFDAKNNYVLPNHTYNIGDEVVLKKGTLIHGTYRNIEGLIEIEKSGLIASIFINGRISKYPSSIGVWNLKKTYSLKEYINFYSGGTIRYNNMGDDKTKTVVIPYNQISNLMQTIEKSNFHRWYMEQTKEARFLPSLVQEKVQTAVILNSNNKYIRKLKENDILSLNINDKDVRSFVDEYYYDNFIKERKNKDDFFTDRESAILFGIPSCFIEGILVGRKYENNSKKLEQIKKVFPKAYICNLDGKVIVK